MTSSKINDDRELNEYYYLQTLDEYKTYIIQGLNNFKNKKENGYKFTVGAFAIKDNLPSPVEFEKAVQECGELDDRRRLYLALYEYFYNHGEHKDVDEWHRRYEWSKRRQEH